MSRTVAVTSVVLSALVAVAAPRSAHAQQDEGGGSEQAPAAESAERAARAPRLGRSSTILSPGVLGSYGGGASGEFGVGLELRLVHYPTRYSLRFGGFVQGEVQSDGTVRMVGGLANGLWLFGCELGLAYRTDTGRYASSLGLHIGKTIDFGPVRIGGRITIPLVDFQPPNTDGRLVQGVEGALVVSFQIPSTVDGPERRPFDCGHHRRR
jgi:hypothetical protein